MSSIYIHFKFLFMSILVFIFSMFNIFDLSLLCWDLHLVKPILWKFEFEFSKKYLNLESIL